MLRIRPSERSDDSMRCTDNLGQHRGHVQRQSQSEPPPTRLNPENAHLRAVLCIKELQCSQQSQPVQGVSLTGFRKVCTATVVKGSRRPARVHRVNHQRFDTSLKEGKRAEEVRLGGQSCFQTRPFLRAQSQ